MRSSRLKGQAKDETNPWIQILEGSPIPTFVIDSNSIITHWNRACEVLTQLPASAMVGTDKHLETFYALRRPLMADLIVKHAGADERTLYYGDKIKRSRLIRGGFEGEDFFPTLGENGKWLFFTAAPLKNAHGDIIGAIETLQDVTQRRLAEREVRASEARYRQLFESANDAIFVLRDDRIVDCNRKALDLFHASRKDLIGQPPKALCTAMQPDGASSANEVDKKLSMVFQEVEQLFEWRCLRKDGSQFDAEISLTRFRDSDSLHALAVLRDITARKKMIQTLKEHQKELDEKGRYLENVIQALKASLDHREVERRVVEENIMLNLKRFVFPYLDQLGQCKMSADAKASLNMIDANLKAIVSEFSKTLFSKYIDFTPTEVRIADFIRNGNNSKAIAQQLGLSPSSVLWHRKNIREKLGLTNKKINLYTYLASLGD